MKQRGFMPFSAAGVVVLMLVVAMLGHGVWLRHQDSLGTIDRASASALLTILKGFKNDLEAAARYAVYDALWEVCKNASDFGSDEARESAIERLAESRFKKRITELQCAYSRHDPRVELRLMSPHVTFDLRKGEGGFALASVRLPKGTSLRVSSWDNSLSIELPCEDLEVFIDSRYFLLQERMRNFIEGLGSVGMSWAIMEYISAWGGAWVMRKVDLEPSRSKAFFELAWATHELNTFGSADYAATALGLMGATADNRRSGDVLNELKNSPVVTPLRATDVETMRGYVELALEELVRASTSLKDTKSNVGRARELSSAENSSMENVRREILEAAKSIGRARSHIAGVAVHFRGLIDFTSSSAVGNVVMAALHESLVEGIRGDFMRGDYPSPAKQVEWGVRGVDSKR